MKHFIMQFSPLSSYFLPLISKCSPQHPVLRHPQTMCMQQESSLHEFCPEHLVFNLQFSLWIRRFLSGNQHAEWSTYTTTCNIHKQPSASLFRASFNNFLKLIRWLPSMLPFVHASVPEAVCKWRLTAATSTAAHYTVCYKLFWYSKHKV